MGGIGIGGATCAAFVVREREGFAITGPPLLASCLVPLVPVVSSWYLPGLAVLLGTLFGVSLPVMTSFAQQSCPKYQRLASSVTMGASWGIGSGIVAVAIYLHQKLGSGTEPVFVTFAAIGAMSCVLSCVVAWRIHREGTRKSSGSRDGHHDD